MEPTTLQNVESWATIVGAGILFVGAIVAFWKLVIQQPYGSHWHVSLKGCDARRIGDRWAYVMSIGIENRSVARKKVSGWWRRVIFPQEAVDDYDPNVPFTIRFRSEAEARYGKNILADDPYFFSAGEQITDQFIEWHEGNLQEVCYVEFTLEYRVWKCLTWWKLPYPGRRAEFFSQKMVAAVSRAGFANSGSS